MTRRPAILAIASCMVLVSACSSNTSSSNTSGEVSASTEPSVASMPVSPATRSPGLSGSSLPSSAPGSSQPSSSGSALTSVQQGQYCSSKGGEVQTRDAYWGTNGDEAGWVELAGRTSMCRFTSDDEARSRIYVDLTTLSSPVPTLAALAYLSKVPMPSTTGGANPATGYCSKELGGSSTFGGISAAGGGWVANEDPDDVIVALCVFPDLSFIDEWGLAYHSDGSIRGTDLATAMAYRPAGPLPPVFPSGSAAAPTS